MLDDFKNGRRLDLIVAFDEDSFLVYEIQEGLYIIVGLGGNRKITVCNNWIFFLRHRDYALKVDNSYDKYEEGWQIICENREEVERQLCRVYGMDPFLMEWQKELLTRAKPGQKMVY